VAISPIWLVLSKVEGMGPSIVFAIGEPPLLEELTAAGLNLPDPKGFGNP